MKPERKKFFFMSSIAIIITCSLFILFANAARENSAPRAFSLSNLFLPTAEPRQKPMMPKPKILVPILMYHYIRVDPNPNDPAGINLSVAPNTFRQQLQWLSEHNYQSITPDELTQILAAKLKLNKKPVMLTFDDGYEDAYSEAFPALRDYGFFGVFYVPSGFLDRPDYLTQKQLKLMAQSGMVIADHTISHADLTSSKLSWAERQTELETSKLTLEALVGKPVEHLAYPYGTYNESVITLAKALGYKTAVTTHSGFATEYSDLMKLPRIRVMQRTDLARLLP